MAQTTGSMKRLAISKASAQIVAIAGIAGFITVFSLVASQALWAQNSYLSRVAGQKSKADKQLQDNLDASDKLVSAYTKFVSQPVNALGGDPKGSTVKDGDNGTIVLDALPRTYDFPALTASIQKILTDLNLKVTSIAGTDDEVAQQTAASSPTPQPVPMNFSFIVAGANYKSVQAVIDAMQRSIRPIQIDSLSMDGSNSNMQLTVMAHTFYQPPKSLNIKLQVVK